MYCFPDRHHPLIVESPGIVQQKGHDQGKEKEKKIAKGTKNLFFLLLLRVSIFSRHFNHHKKCGTGNNQEQRYEHG